MRFTNKNIYLQMFFMPQTQLFWHTILYRGVRPCSWRPIFLCNSTAALI